MSVNVLISTAGEAMAFVMLQLSKMVDASAKTSQSWHYNSLVVVIRFVCIMDIVCLISHYYLLLITREVPKTFGDRSKIGMYTWSTKVMFAFIW